ncbi:MAG: hypothetical protein AAF841_08055 [Pseudomonadota bacterium]
MGDGGVSVAYTGVSSGPVKSLAALTKLGRVRLSKYFYARNFLNSEIGNFHRIPNLVDDKKLFVEAGRRLCQHLLDPLVETFGPIEIRSAHRHPEVNAFGNAHDLGCARNEANYAGHIWDRRDAQGRLGACASVMVPWFGEQGGRDWRDLAWWIHDHLPYHAMWFFPMRAALNLTWREDPARKISSYIAPKGTLLAAGAAPSETRAQRAARYADFPPFRGIAYPVIPGGADAA